MGRRLFDTPQDLVLGRSVVSANNTPPLVLPEHERFYHIHILGRPGSGKSTLMKNLILQDILEGRGCCVLDPHGDLVEDILAHFPNGRLNDLAYLDPSLSDAVCSINPLFAVPSEQHSLVVSNVIEMFRSIWPEGFGPRMEDVFRNSLLALLEQPPSQGVSLSSITRLLQDPHYRRSCLKHVQNSEVRNFFEYDFNRLPLREQIRDAGPVKNKLRAFLSDPLMRDIFALSRPTLDLQRAMEDGRVILVNLSQGKIGSNNARLLGSIIISSLRFAAQACAQDLEHDRLPFHLYIDEFQNFVTQDLVRGFAEVRKHRLSYVVAHQHRTQLPPELIDAVKETVGTMVAFALGIEDARYYAPVFEPVSPTHLSSQDVGFAFVRHAYRSGLINQLSVDRTGYEKTNVRDKALRISREHFYLDRARARSMIEKSERRHREKFPFKTRR